MKKALKEAIDELAHIRETLKPLNKREEELKAMLEPLGVGVHKGIKYYLVVEEGTNSRFDAKALKAAIPMVTWFPFWHTSTYIKMSAKPMAAKVESEAA